MYGLYVLLTSIIQQSPFVLRILIMSHTLELRQYIVHVWYTYLGPNIYVVKFNYENTIFLRREGLTQSCDYVTLDV